MMPRLSDFRQYLDDRRSVLQKIEDHLCDLQGKYESYFAEVTRARENEVRQLIDHTLEDRSALPDWYNQQLDATHAEVQREFDEKLEKLRVSRQEAVNRAAEIREKSRAKEHQIRRLNTALDREEEALKERNARLLVQIREFNDRISSMGRGFGFFSNLFKMRSLAKEKAALDHEQRDVMARIEALRGRWRTKESEYAVKEDEYQENWRAAEKEAAALSAQLESLEHTRAVLEIRSTVERVLQEQNAEVIEPRDDDPQCPRCRVRNPQDNFFCHICAIRLAGDREDFDGSMEEMREINRHYQRFSEGMAACQQIIGLVRGMKSGVEAFTESVADVQESERKYPLPKLEIAVPQESVDFGSAFDMLLDMVRRQYSVHPKVFAEHVGQLIDQVFTEDAIQAFFERMGAELSAQADEQWK